MSEDDLNALINKGKNAELSHIDQVHIALELEYYHRVARKLEGILHIRIKEVEEEEHERRIKISENL